MNELIEIKINENQEPIVSARELHKFLGLTERFQKWFEKQVEYGFVENEDFCSVKTFTQQNQYGGEKELQDYALKLDMAKELSMIQRNERGKQARQYFIQVEKDWNSPDKIMARALIVANKTIESKNLVIKKQTKEIEENKPKVIFADAVTASEKSILVGELAKILKQNGVETGERRLFEWLRKHNYLIRRKGSDYNMPTQKSMNMGLFQVKETAVTHSDGHVTVNKTAKVTGKGQIYFINRFKKLEMKKEQTT